MPGYLEGYGEGEERRGKVIRWVVLGVLSVAVVGGLLYFLLHDFSESRAIKAFVAALQAKDYQGAYRMWGCTEATPCRDYRFEKFMEDWGPQSPAADASRITISQPQLSPGVLGWIRNQLGVQHSCNDGVIYHLNLGKGEPAILYVFRKDKAIGFAPWPVCSPHFKK